MNDDQIIKSYVWHNKQCFFVSTIERDSSALEGGRYNETMIWEYNWGTRERADKFFFQSESRRGSITEHLQVCERLFSTGSAVESTG